MNLLVTSAAGANGDGYGKLLAFDRDGRPLGVFSDDCRIAAPRGLAADRDSGQDPDKTAMTLPDSAALRQTRPGNIVYSAWE